MTFIDPASYEPLTHTQIDQEHLEFIALLNQLEFASNADFPALFQALYSLTEAHFDYEAQLMQDSAFPAAGEHNGEHQRVLAEFKQFKTRIDKGLISFGRAFVQERLPHWLPLHTSTMDGALVAHLNRQA
jgi:hemerythrin-like metal-binding protein